jgi:hypothetical protein
MCVRHPHRRLALPIAFAALVAGCAYEPKGALVLQPPTSVQEGERAAIGVTVTNVFPEAIIPVSLTLYARTSPTEYFAVRHLVADTQFLDPLRASEVFYLQTLDRIEAVLTRDGQTWRLAPHSRFLHPSILLPGQSFTHEFQFQAYASYGRLLMMDFTYLRLSNEEITRNLYVTSDPLVLPAEADHTTQVYHRITAEQLANLDPSEPKRYLLYRPRMPSVQQTHVITKNVPLPVQPRAFSYAAAARQARFGARTHCFFAAANVWVFDYENGTWFIGPDATTKLTGNYLDIVADLQARAATELVLAAPRVAGDQLLAALQEAGYSDPKAVTPEAQAVIPAADLVATLQKAESLGYTITAHTWHAAPTPP